MSPHAKTIAKRLKSVGYAHDLYRVFSDCMEVMAISISNAVDLSQAAEREARYLAIIKRYDRNTVSMFAQVLGDVCMGLEAGPCDLLGQAFGELEVHNAARGQFFTPFEVCRLMAGLTISDGAAMRQAIQDKGYVTLVEPACGSGAMVLAMAEQFQLRGLNYQKQLHVTAVDLDARAAHMAFVQLSLLHIPAIVIVGNSLTQKCSERWYTPAHILGGWHERLSNNQGESPQRAAQCVDRNDVAPLVPVNKQGHTSSVHRQGLQLQLF